MKGVECQSGFDTTNMRLVKLINLSRRFELRYAYALHSVCRLDASLACVRAYARTLKRTHNELIKATVFSYMRIIVICVTVCSIYSNFFMWRRMWRDRPYNLRYVEKPNSFIIILHKLDSDFIRVVSPVGVFLYKLILHRF